MSSDSNENSIPPITADVTEAEIRMNVKDKLQLIDKEVRELYEFCVKAGYTPEQIELCATPMLAVETSVKRKSWFKRLGYLLGVVLLVFFFVYYEPAYYNICIYAKLASMKVLPYWDWRYIYDEFCFVKNPYYVEQKLTKKDCRENCKELKTIGVIEKTDANEMSDFLFSETPVIINDATDDWQARKDFSIEFLAKLYSENSILRNNEVCNFQTTIDGDYNHPTQFLSDVINGKIQDSYETHWENCDSETAKIMRQFYRRPYFLPPMVEASESNWMTVSQGGNKSLKVTWSSSMTWMSQITGRSRIILRPDAVCKGICRNLRTELEAGDSLVFVNEMWSMSYKPLGDTPVIAIGATGIFDRID